MAKRQAMNLFEAHVEKLVLALTVLVLVWVVVFKLVNPPAVTVGGESLKPSEAADKGLRASEEAVRKIAETARGEDLPKPELAIAGAMFEAQQYAFNTNLTSQPVTDDPGIQDKRQYLLPAVPELTDVIVDFTRAMAAPTSQPGMMGGMDPGMSMGGMMGGMDMGMGGGMAMAATTANLIDVDFVTVEAKFTMLDFYRAFEASLKGPDIAKPLAELPAQPIIAIILLERREIMPDGQWSNAASVPFVSVNAGSINTLSLELIEQMSPAVLEGSMKKAAAAYPQQMLLIQPVPYNLPKEPWKSPSQKEAEKAATGGRPGRNAAGAGGANPAMGGGMMNMGGMGMDPAMGGMSGAADTNLLSNELKVWAHDNTVKPGAIYDYRISLGFFNPLYGRNWYGPGQENLKDQKILWTRRAAPKKVIQVPYRTIFFPKVATGGNAAEKVASVTVFRYQEGKWYDRAYRILPGTTIGTVEEIRPRTPSTSNRPGAPKPPQAEPVKVDFRTGITVVDILPNSKHWAGTGPSDEIVCTDIILRNADGSVQRMGTEKNTWPSDYTSAYTLISREMRNQRESESNQPPPGMGGMGPGGMGPLN